MEVVSILNSVKCITLIFGLFTGNIQTTDSILVDRDKGHDFHATKKKNKKDKTHPQLLHSAWTLQRLQILISGQSFLLSARTAKTKELNACPERL